MDNGNYILGLDSRAGFPSCMHACMQWKGMKEVGEELQMKRREGSEP
jgi:hypothetical protein